MPFESLIAIDKTSAIPLYQQIANALISLIQGGLLRPGAKIPSSRQMADILHVHRKTVVAAYEEMDTQDWIKTVPRKHAVVSSKLPELKPTAFSDLLVINPYQQSEGASFLKSKPASAVSKPRRPFSIVVNDGFPDARLAPMESLLKQYRSFLRKSYAQNAFMLGAPAGADNLRTEISKFIGRTRAINIGPENVMITRGAQMAIFIAAATLLKPGSTVIVGAPGYFMANNIFEHFGAKLISVKVDEQGIDVDEIARLVRKKKPDLLYVIPHHHHPTTVTLSAERRMKLLSIIREYRLSVIEDDYDYDFHYSKTPILPLASADHGGYVTYIGSVTKSFASSIRIGYMVAGQTFIDQASGIREMIDIRGDILMEEALASLYRNGEMQRHLNKAVKVYQERRDYFCGRLSNELGTMLHFIKPSGGMAVWVVFKKPYRLTDISAKLAGQGIFISDGNMYNTAGSNYNALRMGFALMAHAEMDEVVEAFKSCL